MGSVGVKQEDLEWGLEVCPASAAGHGARNCLDNQTSLSNIDQDETEVKE